MLNIKQRQLNLRTYYFYYTGNIDGIEGNKTKEAYKKFQINQGLVVDGIYGNNTDNKLILVIKDIQSKLNTKGFNLTIDGIVGTNTINSIKSFQSKNGLTVDGIVGTNTYSKLNEDDWDSIKYFKKQEFACKCGCGLNNMDLKVVKVLDQIREHFKNPILVTSGSRCKKHNRDVGGAENSKHLYGKAIDFVVSGVNKQDVVDYTNELVKSGSLRYTYSGTRSMGNAVHIDIE